MAETQNKTTGHTPGPWRVAIDGTNTGRGPVILGEDNYYDDGSPREICKLETSEMRGSLAVHPHARWRRTRDADEIDANARLIAAAPDLLEACKLATKVFFHNNLRSSFPEAMEALSDAIAKAGVAQ